MTDEEKAAAEAARRVETMRRGRVAVQRLSGLLGKRYAALERLAGECGWEEASDLERLARDVEYDLAAQRRRGAREPWRR